MNYPSQKKIKMFNNYPYLLIVLIAIISCNTPSTLVQFNQKQKLPANFGNETANTKADTLKWQYFSKDSVLKALIDTAIENNNDIQIAYQKIELARGQRQFTKGSLLPQLGIGSSGSIRKFGLYTMDGAGNIVTEMTPGKLIPIDLPDMYLGLQSTWEVDIRGRLKNLDQAALNRFFASQEGFKFVINIIATDVAISYYELLALDNELIVIRENANKEKEALEFIKAQKEAGKINELAVQQFTAQYYNLIVIEKEVLQNIKKEENRLNFLLGRYPQPIHRSQNSLYNTQDLIDRTIPSTILQNRPDIKSAELRLIASKFDLKAAKAAFYPSFSLNIGYGLQAFNSNYWFRTPESIAYNVVGNLAAPIVNRSAIKAQFNNAKSAQIEAMHLYQQLILNAYIDVVNNFTEIKHLGEIKKITENKAISYKQAVESSFDLYKAARVPYIDVLFSQQNALQTNIELIRIHKRSKITEIKLFKDLGGQW